LFGRKINWGTVGGCFGPFGKVGHVVWNGI
jgi:hypothetical protein